jgi:hypothetical protein
MTPQDRPLTAEELALDAIDTLNAAGFSVHGYHAPDTSWMPCTEERCLRIRRALDTLDATLGFGVSLPAEPGAPLDPCPECAPHPVHGRGCDEPGYPGATWMCNCRYDPVQAAEDAALDAAIEERASQRPASVPEAAPGPRVTWKPADRTVLAVMAPIVDGLCSGCGTKPTRETGSCRCLFRVDDVIRGKA